MEELRGEINAMRDMLERYSATQNLKWEQNVQTIAEVKLMVKMLEEKVEEEDHGKSRSKKTLLHAKSITPEKLGKAESWRIWREDAEDYCEEIIGGMKELMEETRKETREVTKENFKHGEQWWDKA